MDGAVHFPKLACLKNMIFIKQSIGCKYVLRNSIVVVVVVVVAAVVVGLIVVTAEIYVWDSFVHHS